MTADKAIPEMAAQAAPAARGEPGKDPVPAAPPGSLRGHADFNKLWFGQAVSSVGSQVTLLALPLTAVLYLHASAGQVGLMRAAGLLAYCGPSLLFGVMADRMRRRPLMIVADIGRTAVIGVVPVLAWTGHLTMPVLYAVALIQGGLTIIFEVAYRSYLPSLIGADTLLGGNSKLQSTASVAQIGGPGLAGTLVALIGAPFTVLVDAGSFVVSWASLLWIRTPEPAPEPRDPAARSGVAGVFAEVGEGLRFIYRNPVLRALATSAGTFNFFSQLQLTLFVVYAARTMHLSPGAIGGVLACFGIGGLGAAVTVRRALAWLGYGRLLLTAYSLAGLAILGIPLAPGPPVVTIALYAVIYFVAGYGIVATNVATMTLRQIATPNALHGRVNAGFRFAIGALMPFAAALAGFLGERLGLRVTLFICAGGMPISVLLVALSPARRVKSAQEVAAA